MNCRDALPALSAIVVSIFLLTGIALSDNFRGSEALKAQTIGFDALANKMFGGPVTNSGESSQWTLSFKPTSNE